MPGSFGHGPKSATLTIEELFGALIAALESQATGQPGLTAAKQQVESAQKRFIGDGGDGGVTIQVNWNG